MQIQSVETRAGTAIWAAPSRNSLVQRLAFLQMTGDIFNGYRGVVHQDPDGQGQAAQRHQVDGLMQEAQDNHGAQDGQRNRNSHDHGAPPASQEDQDHQRREDGGDASLSDNAADGSANENGLVCELLNLELRRQRLLNAGKQVANALDHAERGRVAVFDYSGQNTTVAILTNDVGLRDETIAHVRDISEIDSRVAHHFNRQVVHFLDRSRRGVGGDVVLESIDLCSSRRRDDILRVHRVHYVLRRESLGLKQSAIQVDHHFSLLAAVRIRHRRAGNGHQLRPQEVQGQVIQVRLAESRPGKSELENRHTGGGVVHNQRRQRSRRLCWFSLKWREGVFR
jgi:hypothetical protein